MTDMLREYLDGDRSVVKRIRTMESRIESVEHAGFRREGQSASSTSPSTIFVTNEIVGGGGGEVGDTFTGSNQVIVSDDLGAVAVVTVPDHGIIAKGGPGNGIAGVQHAPHSMIGRTGGVGSSLPDGLKSFNFLNPASLLMKTRGAVGPFGQDLLVPLSPNQYVAEFFDAASFNLSDADITLSNDGPFQYWTLTNNNARIRFDLPTYGTAQPGSRWNFFVPKADMTGTGSNPGIEFDPPHFNQRINNATSTIIYPGGRFRADLVCVGVSGNIEYYSLNFHSQT